MGQIMTTDVVVPFPVQPDLAATMDIQIPALAWQPSGNGSWQRTYQADGAVTEVTVSEDDHALRFRVGRALPAQATSALAAVLRRHFPRQVSTLNLDSHPVLAAMSRRYRGVVIMAADPFEALILTVLSQNRTGEIVRKLYPRLEARCGGMTPRLLASVGEADLAKIIRSAGPYKARWLTAAARCVVADSPDVFTEIITRAPAGQAMEYLTSLPGVGHKTAACVLVYAAQSTHTLPVDTHLFRVTRRLGLTSHAGTLTADTRDAIVATMLSHGPDLAPAHFLFLLLGRATCTASLTLCGDCFLGQLCPSARGINQTPERVGDDAW
jgi:endonuclease III